MACVTLAIETSISLIHITERFGVVLIAWQGE